MGHHHGLALHNRRSEHQPQRDRTLHGRFEYFCRYSTTYCRFSFRFYCRSGRHQACLSDRIWLRRVMWVVRILNVNFGGKMTGCSEHTVLVFDHTEDRYEQDKFCYGRWTLNKKYQFQYFPVVFLYFREFVILRMVHKYTIHFLLLLDRNQLTESKTTIQHVSR